MIRRLSIALSRALFLLAPLCVQAQSAPPSGAQQPADALGQKVIYMLQNHNARTICLGRDATAGEIRAELLPLVADKGGAAGASIETVGTLLWTKYPCPFSPLRPEVRAAKPADMAGVWLYPEASQKFRRGPQVPAPVPQVKCESLGFYEKGELRVAGFAGESACPFKSAAVLAAARKYPVVSTWAMNERGRLIVSRTDVKNHVEEWEYFVVTKEFSMYGNTYAAGDLLGYLRKDSASNLFNVATEFRHLQALK